MCSIEDSCEDDLSNRAMDFEPSKNRIPENVSLEFFQDMIGTGESYSGNGKYFSEARLKLKSQKKLLIDRFVPNRLASNTELFLADTSPARENTR